MQLSKLLHPAEVRSVLQDLSEGDIEAFSKLQPKLFRALPMVQQQPGQPPMMIVTVVTPSEAVAMLKCVAAAASRGLELLAQG